MWGDPEVTVVDGEVESVQTAPGLTWTVRHHVTDAVWNVRGVLAAAEPITLGSARVEVDAGEAAAWVWAAGTAGLVILADDPERPVGLRLRRGRILPPEPGEPYGFAWWEPGAEVQQFAVVECTATRCDTWLSAVALLPQWLPTLALPAGDDLVLTMPDDSVTGPGVTSTADGAVSVTGVGHSVVRIQGVSGDLILGVDFGPALADCLSRTADRIVTESPSRPAPAEVVAAQVMILAASAQTDNDAYDLLTAELAESHQEGSLRTMALALAAAATPERWLVDALAVAAARIMGPAARTLVKAVLRATVGSSVVSDRIRACPLGVLTRPKIRSGSPHGWAQESPAGPPTTTRSHSRGMPRVWPRPTSDSTRSAGRSRRRPSWSTPRGGSWLVTATTSASSPGC